tara:strand:- start:151 stop:765 length:615 start_codon:yes stop_codon:yes gene_type:complete
LRKFFKNLLKPKKDSTKNQIKEDFKYLPSKDDFIEEKFTKNFTNNGGKFLYAANKEEFKEYFDKVINENDWDDKSILCLNDIFLEDFVENIQLKFNKTNLNSHILVTACEFLVANDGSILVSAKQIQSHKIKDIPNNIVVFAKTSQLSETVSKGLEGIRIKYSNNLPSNITSIKNFNVEEKEKLNFLTYGTSSKNLYLILLEDL